MLTGSQNRRKSLLNNCPISVETVHLARLGEDQWVPSDARVFNNWFYERLERNEQMRSCIKYLKAWKDFSGSDLKGIHLTALVGLNHVPVKDRDDISLTKTVGEIVDYLKENKAIYNPIDDKENLIGDWPDSKTERAIDALERLHAKALEALDEEDKGAASKKWIVVLGIRFPEHEEDACEAKVAVAPLPRDQRPPAKLWSHS